MSAGAGRQVGPVVALGPAVWPMVTTTTTTMVTMDDEWLAGFGLGWLAGKALASPAAGGVLRAGWLAGARRLAALGAGRYRAGGMMMTDRR